MTVPTWRCKSGDDFYAPAPIVVKVGGVAQDLTDPDWELAAQGRTTDKSTVVAFTPTWDTDPAKLEVGEVWFIIDRADTVDLSGVHVIDLQVTNDAIPAVKRKTSETWTITFVDDVTQDVPA